MVDVVARSAGAAGGGGVGEAALEVVGVRVVYRVRRVGEIVALDGLSLSVRRGERVALLGPNGAGKSTLLRLWAGVERAEAGDVRVTGEDPWESRTGRDRLGVVFQRPGLDGLLTVRENLAAQAALFGIAGREAAERVGRAAAALGLEERMHQRVGTLSGGYARRVDLARALVGSPEVLLLDEPTAGLDPRSRAEFLGALEGVWAACGDGRPMTIVLSTHLMDEAERAGRVVMMHRGRVVADDEPGELRREMGGTLVRVNGTDERARAAMEGAGLVVSGVGGGMVGRVATGEDRAEKVSAASAALVRAGVAFEVGPPTLADVYFERTGASLGTAQ